MNAVTAGVSIDRIFPTAREAKEFLVERILSQAKREGISLSDVERKMLYFSEAAWTLPDMDKVSEEFDRECDQDEYESKIAAIVRNIMQEQAHNGIDDWDNAVRILSKEDHYILVLIGLANKSRSGLARPRYDRLKLILAALLVIAAMLTIMYLGPAQRLMPEAVWRRRRVSLDAQSSPN